MPSTAPQLQVPDSGKFLKVDEDLGVVFGWGLICKRNGEDYYDLHNDNAAEAGMLAASVDFMSKSQRAKEMHVGGVVGQAFVFPLTTEIAKSLGINSDTTGMLLGWKPDDKAVLQKFRDGTYTGFSIGGSYVENEDVPTGIQKTADVIQLPTFQKRSEDFGKAAVRNLDRKRKMVKFTIHEISAVDKGAQEGALATIMKRADGAPENNAGELMEKLMLLTSVDGDHQHGISLDRYDLKNGGGSTHGSNLAGGDGYHSHPYVINADGTLTIGMSDGHTHDASASTLLPMLQLQEVVKRIAGNKDDEDAAENQADPRKLPKKDKGKGTGTVKKTDDGKDYVAGDYACVPNADDSTTWKYRTVRRSGSRADKAAVGRAVSMFKRDSRLGNVRDETTVIRRLRKAWVDSHPGTPRSAMPLVLKRVTS